MKNFVMTIALSQVLSVSLANADMKDDFRAARAASQQVSLIQVVRASIAEHGLDGGRFSVSAPTEVRSMRGAPYFAPSTAQETTIGFDYYATDGQVTCWVQINQYGDIGIPRGRIRVLYEVMSVDVFSYS